MTSHIARLSATRRTETGSANARQMRREGGLPAVVYGSDAETKPLTLDAHEFDVLMSRIHAATTLIELEVDGADSEQVLIREIQRHPYRSDILHVDFYRIRADEKIMVKVPVHLEGLAVGVDEGGILQQIRHELEVECLPGEIPSEIVVDVTALDIGDSLHIGDVDAPGITIVDDPGQTLCTVVQPTIITVEEEEEEELDELLEGLEGEEVEGEEGEAPEAEADEDSEED